MTRPVDTSTRRPGDSRGTSLCGCGCGRPQDRPGQAYRKDCHTAYMRNWRADQAARLAQLPEAVRQLVVMAGEFRAQCACPPSTGCPECIARRARAARLDEVAALIAPLCRTVALTDS